MKQFFKNKLAVVVAGIAALVMVGAVAHAALLPVNDRAVIFSASASVSGSSVTISVSNGTLSMAGLTDPECVEKTPADPAPYPTHTGWYSPIASQTTPASTAQITSGVLSGQTIPLSVGAGNEGSNCWDDVGSAATFSGSRTFTNVAAGSHTVNVRVTDNRGQVANRSVSFTIAGVPTCSASPAAVNPGQAVTFAGANGSTYTWSAPGANTTSGSGSTFATSYATTGTKTVTVTSGGQSGTCTVQVQAVAAVSCSPSTQEVGVNQTATLTASGGNGSYTWSTTGGSPSSGSGSSFSTSYSSADQRTVVVSSGGLTANCLVDVQVPQSAPQLTLSASPNPVALNAAPTLTWTVTGATSCTDSPDRWYWTGPFAATNGTHSSSAGSVAAHTVAGQSRNYTMVCSNASGQTITDTVTVDTIDSSIGVDISANPASGVSPLNTTLSWTTTGNPTSCSATPNGTWTGSKASTSGTTHVQPINGLTQTTDFTITCTKGSETVSDTVTVTVGTPAPGEPWVGLTANPTTVDSGGTSVLNWQAVNALSCQALSSVPANAQWTGSKNVNGGNQSITNITQNTTFTIECYGATGTAVQASASVSVTPPPATGTIVVVSNEPTTWTISGPADYTTIGNQTSVTYQNVPTGSYTIAPVTPAGYVLDSNQSSVFSQLVTAGNTTTFVLHYVPEPVGGGASVDISANPTTVGTGGSSSLSWTSDGIEPGTCVASGGWSGSQDDTGDDVGTGGLDEDTTFTITCVVAGSKVDTVEDSVMVTVSDEGGPGGNPECSDGIDNFDPEDTLADAADPDCYDEDDNYDPTDNNETNIPVPGDDDDDPIGACNDGFDNDGDGNADYPDDTGCSSPTDTTEQGSPDIREI